jgi:hypothetical protein
MCKLKGNYTDQNYKIAPRHYVYDRRYHSIRQWSSNGAPQEVARWAANIMKAYFKNEKKYNFIEIYYIHDFYFYS